MHRVWIALGLVVLSLSAAQAQVAPPAAIPPELALDRTLPIDPAVKSGKS